VAHPKNLAWIERHIFVVNYDNMKTFTYYAISLCLDIEDTWYLNLCYGHVVKALFCVVYGFIALCTRI